MDEPLRWQTPLGPDVTRDGEVDVCVIGSGAGGGPVAFSLARAGFRVVVLEKGPAYDQRDFIYDEIRSVRRNFFTPFAIDEPHMRELSTGEVVKTSQGWTANCIGGGTVHYSGFTFRVRPEDLRVRSLLGPIAGSTLADWPISWEEFVRYYDIAEVEIGVSGDALKNPFDLYRRPLPLPPLAENGMAPIVDAACAKLGYHAYPTARAILSRPYNGRGSCRREHQCSGYGCELGAKSSTLAALHPRALQTGNCQIRPRAMVYRIESDETGRATAVHYFDARGQRQRLRARIVVVACSAVESARLLLLSPGKAHPHGLANHNGWVGQNLIMMSGGGTRGTFSRQDPRIASIDCDEAFVNRAVFDLFLLREGRRSLRKCGVANFLMPFADPMYGMSHAAARDTDTPVWGKALKVAMRRIFHQTRTLDLEVFCETMPVWENRVSLDPEVRDKWGLPVARYRSVAHPLDRETLGIALPKAVEVLETMGAIEARSLGASGTYWLQGGTCRFGDDPQTSVLDRDCRAHSARNLFVTDGSFLPNSTGIPFTFTIETNAFRVADRIVALAKAGEI